MDKKIIIAIVAVVLLIGLGVGGYLYWHNQKKSEKTPETNAIEKAGETANQITEEATKGVLPSIQTNPLENKPDVNPASQANPIKDIKTNPFD
ncbi:hypothetical protein COU03_03890 [bacterium (Candidatus Gribaldobacteria) CG10_big_fil_rev_8_21_14_0_10_41_12]|uniref:Uncharacterized protein n=1 Tax=bacterium (Candidatus Gribaldobacteria) CG10_big_fil_rev_8_21_14_0_10_41_12 TaxID=2014277 RepID=A0A2H0UVJ9_9BACT|nr:MAG: hypothetical protein AUJ36_00490 [Parcubacteria group bacterium CG1_02_41_26]PIR90858.1 MAG: hypothetical protein COU03_03890 [bacterium (Candidatus Gribaldobacteria) CG10_big_fil_rev_8_21_14_0_10_41_12]